MGLAIARRLRLPSRRSPFSTRLGGVEELLDGPLDPELLLGNLRDLARINRMVGGTALTRRALVTLATGFHPGPRGQRVDWRSRPLRLLDIGSGAGDIPAALLDWADRAGRRLEIDAVDERLEIVDVAWALYGSRPGLRLGAADGTSLPHPDGSYDIAHCSLVAHHLEPDHLLRLLQEMRRLSTTGVIVNDLDRGLFRWLGAWLFAHLVTRNRYTRHDAPLSVRRAYRPAEIAQLAARAGLVEVGRWRGPLRYRYALAFVPASVTPAAANPSA